MTVEDWAEIRRLHRSEGMAIKAIGRELGISRNAVRRALARDTAPRYERVSRGSRVDAVEPRIRELLQDPDDAGHGDRGADRLGARLDGAQGSGSGAAALLSASGSGLAD
jgi:hypothetical protein